MSHAANVLHLRISRLLPLHLKRALHPAELQRLCQQAAGNGWTDADWLAGIALEGTDHPATHDPAAVFVHRLRAAAATACPGTADPTPTPPLYADLAHATRPHGPFPDPQQLQAHLAACRQAIAR